MSPAVHDADISVQTQKFLPFKMEGLTPEIVRKAEEELNETPEKKQEALKELKILINEEEDFEPCMDDNFLLRFLRVKKFNTKKAMETLKNFYAYKARYSGRITDRLPSELKNFTDLNATSILQQRDRDGCAIIIMRSSRIDFNKISYNDAIAAFIMCMAFVLQSEATQICGIVIVANHIDVTLRKTRQVASPIAAYRIAKAAQDCIPVRIKAIHNVNEPFYCNIAWNVLKPFLSEKIKKRFHFHGKQLENLYKDVPQEILPSELGGYQGPMDYKSVPEEILNSDHYFSKFFKYGFKGKRANQRRRTSIFY